jgi:deazaflavin-dependent oxidoreductase (nitroreductase family)
MPIMSRPRRSFSPEYRVEADPDAAEYDYEAVARALDIGPDSSAAERTIDITTLGARSGTPRRIEVWLRRVDGRWYLTGMPRPRSWYANLRAHPRFIVHLKHGSRPTCPRPRRRSTSRHGGG